MHPIPKKFRYWMYLRAVENKQLIKGSLNVIILKLLKEHDSMYGYEVTQHVKELTRGGVQITEGALYPALHKLEAEGLISSHTLEINGRKRRYYQLSEKGQKSATAQIEELNAFLENMKLLLQLKPTT